jgi:hypothetical protein
MPKTSTFQVVERTLDAVEACLPEVIADDMTMFVKNNLSNHIDAFYPHIKSPRP